MNGAPVNLLKYPGGWLALVTGDCVEQQVDAGAVGIVVGVPGDLRTGDSLNSQLFAEFTDEGLLRSFSGLDFAAGELPLEGMAIRFAALAEEHVAGSDDYAGGYYDGLPLSRHVCSAGRYASTHFPSSNEDQRNKERLRKSPKRGRQCNRLRWQHLISVFPHGDQVHCDRPPHQVFCLLQRGSGCYTARKIRNIGAVARGGFFVDNCVFHFFNSDL